MLARTYVQRARASRRRGAASYAAPGHPCSIKDGRQRAHCNCGPSAASAHVVPRAPVLTRPLQHLQVASVEHPFCAPLQQVPSLLTRPTGTRSDAPTAAPPGALPAPRTRTCPRSTGTRSDAPTAAPPGALPAPRQSTCSSSTGTRSDAPTAAPPGALLRRVRARPLVPRPPVLMRPLQHLQVPSKRRVLARVLVPRAPVLTRPLQHLQVPFLRRALARHPVHGHPFSRAHCSPDAPTAGLPGALHTPRTRTCSRPTGTRSREPTAAPPGALPRRQQARGPQAPVLTRPLQHSRCPPRAAIIRHRPTGTRSHAPTAGTSRCPPFAANLHVPRPTGTRSDAPTAAPPGGLLQPRTCTSSGPTGTRSDATTAAPPGALPSPRTRTSTCIHGHPFARKHVRLSIVPRLAANRESSVPSPRHLRPFPSNSCISHSSASSSPSITATASGFITSEAKLFAQLLQEHRSRARHALDRLAARSPRHRERRSEPPELSNHGVEDLGGVAEEGPEDVAVAAELGADRAVHRQRARRGPIRGLEARGASVVAARGSRSDARGSRDHDENAFLGGGDATGGDFDRALIDRRNQGETRRVDFDRRFVKISRSAKNFPVSEHQHAPSRFDVHHRPHTSPFDEKSGSLEKGRRPRRPAGKFDEAAERHQSAGAPLRANQIGGGAFARSRSRR